MNIKRFILLASLVIAALLIGGMALAEEETAVTAHDYLGEWVDQDGTINIDVEAREEGDGYVANVQMDILDGDDLYYNVWAYACVYDEESRTLKSISRITGTGDYEPDNEEEITDIDYEYADAQFFFNADGQLVWSDANLEADDAMAFEHTIGWMDPDYVGPGHHFVGEWNEERVSIEIEETMEDYHVIVAGSTGATEGVYWLYTCDYDAETDSLVSNGELAKKYTYTNSEDGEEYSEEVVYEDGEAVFTLDGDGRLIWEDKKGNDGEGLIFERAAEE